MNNELMNLIDRFNYTVKDKLLLGEEDNPPPLG